MDNTKIPQIKQGVQLVSSLDFPTRFLAHSLHTLVVQETHAYIHVKFASKNSSNSTNSKHPFFYNPIIHLILFF